jgi:hypothetical protein
LETKRLSGGIWKVTMAATSRYEVICILVDISSDEMMCLWDWAYVRTIHHFGIV